MEMKVTVSHTKTNTAFPVKQAYEMVSQPAKLPESSSMERCQTTEERIREAKKKRKKELKEKDIETGEE